MAVERPWRVTRSHYLWSREHEPVVSVKPGATIEFELPDPSDGQLTPASTAADIPGLDWDRIPPLVGPVQVEGAEPGDALQITVRDLVPSNWGWTANLPDFGLLSEDFPEPELKVWRLDPATLAPAEFAPGIHVPLKPFLGTMGCAPAGEGRHDALPPRPVGGNLDLRDCGAGSVLWLPVEVAGALFSCGDAHAAQGDGEVCGTAIETGMTAVLQLDLVKAAHLRLPRFEVSAPVTRHLDGRGYTVTMGIGSDLMEAARTAVREMIDWLAATRGLSRVAAYLLCSVCADLRISEIVDRPNWVVSLYLPKVVFD